MSPFDKRVGSYSKTAVNRSNSRGPQPSSLLQKPPKLGMQNSVAQKKPSPFRSTQGGLASPIRGGAKFGGSSSNAGGENQEWCSDLREIKNKMFAYEQSVGRYVAEVQGKQELIDELLQRANS